MLDSTVPTGYGETLNARKSYVACGRCRNCKERNTGVCLNVNGDRIGGAYGYVDMGSWIGGQTEYVMVPYAD